MRQISDFQNKQVLVLGLAKSGYSAAKLLHQLGANVTINDRSPLNEDAKAIELRAMGIDVVGGGHPDGLVHEDLDVLVKNPGIPYSNPLIVQAENKQVPVITEVELAYRISEAEFIGITGTNGKTTTTMLIGELLAGSSREPLVAGNIGTVLSEVVQKAQNDNVVVTELSSFQLMGVDEFHPRISVVLNLYEAHLDYHGSFKNYADAKKRITMKQTPQDYFVYNADDDHVSAFVEQTDATAIPFSVNGLVQTGAFLQDEVLYYRDTPIIHAAELGAPGAHNIENALAAIAVAKLCGVSDAFIKARLQGFTGVKHRLQYVATVHDRLFYNDSKATNILATTKALNAFSRPVLLLAGGLDRGNSFDTLIPALEGVKALVAFGETKEKIAAAAKTAGVKTIKIVDTVEEAVPIAYGSSDMNDVILLSPACASWDQFRSFQDRGDMFIKMVHKLK